VEEAPLSRGEFQKGVGTRSFQPIIALEVAKNVRKKKFAKKTKFQKVLRKRAE
jgi:hypothetical protein